MPAAETAWLATKKKTLHASERNTARVKKLREAFQKEISKIDPKRLKFVDESGVNLAMTRLYGRAQKGERVVGSVPQNYGDNVTILAALSVEGIQAPMTITGATDSDVFLAYVQHVLCPVLRAGDVVVIDNLSAHKSESIRACIQAQGARLIYLPPYSPDLSPIEQSWSKIKQHLRQAKARTRQALERAIKQALSTITEADARGWFSNCGYTVHAF